MKLSRRNRAVSANPEAIQGKIEKALDLSPETGSLNVFARDEKGRIQFLDSIPLEGLTPGNLFDTMKEAFGGGRFTIVPMDSGKKAGDSFEVNIAGESKKKKPTRDEGMTRGARKDELEEQVKELNKRIESMQEEKRDEKLTQEIRAIREELRGVSSRGEIVDSVLRNFPQLVQGLGGLRPRESAVDQLEKLSSTIRNLQDAIPQAPDPMAYVTKIADLIFRVAEQSRPPVVAGGQIQSGTGSFLGSFLANVVGEVDKRLGGRLTGGVGAQAMPSGTPAVALAGTYGTSVGFSGIPEGTPGVGTQQPGPATAPLNLFRFNFQALGIDPMQRIREMIVRRDDQEGVAEAIVYLLDFLTGFSPPNSPIIPYIRGFMFSPGEGFDKIAPHIPELEGDAQYTARLRGALIAAVGEYLLEVQRRQRGEATPEPSQAEAEPGQPPLNIQDLLRQPAEAEEGAADQPAAESGEEPEENPDTASIPDESGKTKKSNPLRRR